MRSLSLLLLALMALTIDAAAQSARPAASAATSKPHPAKPPFPLLNLADRKSQGQRAIDLLGDRLPEVAVWYGKSADEFRALLLNDRRLKIDQRGRMFVEDELDAPLPATPSPAAASGSISGTLQPLDRTFLLHSRPGAQRTIYLNFVGATLSGTAWNSGGATIFAPQFDLDGIPGTFSAAELQRIQYIWQRVTEDYAPFDVDVTTEAPPADRLTRSSLTDNVFGTTVLITSSTGVYSCSCGGVAYLSVFDDTSDYYKPALVFYNQLGAGNEKNVAEAISHEAGHNMGLQHDGSATAGYYTGHGSGATGWAPIMGVGYYQPLVQWSKGEYSGANSVQDDYVVMASNGLPLRTDDHGNTLGSASALDAASSGGTGITTLSGEGVIERPSDVDVFSFSAGAGPLSLNVATAARSANLDLLIELRDGAGALLATANPLDGLPATLSYSVPLQGTLYLTVQGVGKGDPLGTGYTDYGSLGQYAVSGSVSAAASQPPVAAVTASPSSGTVPLAVSFTSAGSSDLDGSIVSYDWIFGDDSATATGPSPIYTYTAAGSYTAQLKVTDNSGLTSTRNVTISAQSPVMLVEMRVTDITMSLTLNSKSRSARANAAVTVKTANGLALSGATVTGAWSGIVAGTASVPTGGNGVATFASPTTKAANGTFIFTVTGVTLAGHSYKAGTNVETSDSITR